MIVLFEIVIKKNDKFILSKSHASFPYCLLLKSKGTKRSIQALLSCYGIPQSLMTINEYGGPRLDRAPLYEKLNFGKQLTLTSFKQALCEQLVQPLVRLKETRRVTPEIRYQPPNLHPPESWQALQF